MGPTAAPRARSECLAGRLEALPEPAEALDLPDAPDASRANPATPPGACACLRPRTASAPATTRHPLAQMSRDSPTASGGADRRERHCAIYARSSRHSVSCSPRSAAWPRARSRLGARTMPLAGGLLDAPARGCRVRGRRDVPPPPLRRRQARCAGRRSATRNVALGAASSAAARRHPPRAASPTAGPWPGALGLR